MISEKELMQDYVNARIEKERLDDALESAKERLSEAETRLIKAMEDNGAEATAKYEGLGRFQICKPVLRVNIVEGMENEAFRFLKDNGEGDMIKETIHWKSLASVMSDRVEKNEPLPECFKYYFKQSSKWERPK